MHNNFSDVKIIFKFVCIKEKKAKSLSHVQLFAIPWTVAYQTPLAREFFWQEYWSGLPFPPPGDLPNSEIKRVSLMSPALTGRFFTTVPPGKLHQLGYGDLKKCLN